MNSLKTAIFRYRTYTPIPILFLAMIFYRSLRLPYAPQAYLYLNIAAIIFFVAGLALRAWSVGYAGVATRTIEVKAPALTTAGPYSYVRNPIYLGNLLIALGYASVSKVPLLFPLALIFWVAQYRLIISLEEEFLTEKFGDEYREYCRAVPRFMIRLKPYERRAGTFDSSHFLRGGMEYQTVLTIIAVSIIFHLM